MDQVRIGGLLWKDEVQHERGVNVRLPPGLWSGCWMDGVGEKVGGQVWTQRLGDIQVEMLTGSCGGESQAQ